MLKALKDYLALVVILVLGLGSIITVIASNRSKWSAPQEVVAEVVEVRIAARLPTQTTNQTKGAAPKADKTADTIAGAAVGWFILGGPLGVAIGAVAGASDDSGKPIAVSELLGCRMTVKVGGATQVVFTYLDLQYHMGSITECSLRRSGDRLRVQEMRYRGDDLPAHQRMMYGFDCNRSLVSCRVTGKITP